MGGILEGPERLSAECAALKEANILSMFFQVG